jgi:hypothetical protein
MLGNVFYADVAAYANSWFLGYKKNNSQYSRH